MAGQITWTLNVQVSQGPNVSTTDQLEVEAYDKIAVNIKETEILAGRDATPPP